MMDNDLDDLFGDSAPLQLPIPLSQNLVSRINEASLYGCCQCVTVSKLRPAVPKQGLGKPPGQSLVRSRTLPPIIVV